MTDVNEGGSPNPGTSKDKRLKTNSKGEAAAKPAAKPPAKAPAKAAPAKAAPAAAPKKGGFVPFKKGGGK